MVVICLFEKGQPFFILFRLLSRAHRAEPLDALVRPVPSELVSHIIYPHELVELIARRYPESFREHFGADPSGVRQFWEKFLPTPYGRLHPALADKSADDLSHCLPLVLHGDGIPYAHRKSAVFVQFGSLLGGRMSRWILDVFADVGPVCGTSHWAPT